MDLFLQKIRNKCIVKTPIQPDRGIPVVDIIKCVESPERFIIFPIRGSNCFYGYDKVNKWIEQFAPVNECFPKDNIISFVVKLNSLNTTPIINIGYTLAAESFTSKQHGYFYAYLRFKNPDFDRNYVLDLMNDLSNNTPSMQLRKSYEHFLKM